MFNTEIEGDINLKIFGKEISLNLLGNKKTKTELAATVARYPEGTSVTQGFSTYNSIQGTQELSYDLIDELFSRTIINRMINKIGGDAARMDYTVNIVNMEGKSDEELNLIGLEIDSAISRTTLKNIFIDQVLYGTAFLFIKYEGGIPIETYTVSPRNIEPVLVDGELISWKYTEGSNEIELTTKELIAFPFNAKTGEIFGQSIFGPLIQTLELFLNVQLDLSILVDRFALPIIMYAIDNGIEGVSETREEINAFMQSLYEQLKYGNDIGVGSGVTADVLGTSSTLIDFIPVINDLKESLGIIAGVPLQLLGMKGDNLSVTTRQAQTYFNNIYDIQEGVGDVLIENVYVPYLEEHGKTKLQDYKEININFKIQAVEENSKSIGWISAALNLGLIDRNEARAALGYKGFAIPIEEMDVPNIQKEVTRDKAPQDPERDPDRTKKNPDGDPKNRDHTGDDE